MRPRRFPTPLVQIIHTGQSLGAGVNASPALTISPAGNGNVKLFDGYNVYATSAPQALNLGLAAAVTPLRPINGAASYPQNIAGETAEVTFANQLTFLLAQIGINFYSFVLTNVALNGSAMSVIKKGGTGNSYASALFETQCFAPGAGNGNLAANGGYSSFLCGAVLMTHGESDGTSSTYETDLVTLQGNYQTDVQAITGQAKGIPMFVSQQNSNPHPGSGQGASLSAYAQTQVAIDNPSSFVCVGPKYQYAYNVDTVHIVNTSQIQYGEKLAQAYLATVIQGGTWKPLQPTSIVRVGTTVVVNFSPRVGPLVFDTTNPSPHQSGTYAAWANGQGFEAYDSNGLITITSASIGGNEVILTLGRQPVSGLFIGYADTPDTGGAGFSSGRCGQLRDSDPFVGLSSGAHGYNWCVQFVKAVA